MNSSIFFELDSESSKPANGISVFNYKRYKNHINEDNKGYKRTPIFPFYLIISYKKIDFNVHYFYEEGEDQFHYHNTILSLTLSSNYDDYDALSEELKRAFRTSYPNKRNGYISDIINKSKDTECQFIDQVSFINIYNHQKDKVHEVIRTFVLDFMYDLEHSNVFENSKYHDKMYGRLMANKVYKIIVCRSSFYYYLTLYKSVRNKKFKNSVILNSLIESFDKWYNLIIDERSIELFDFLDNNWVMDNERELKNARKEFAKIKEEYYNTSYKRKYKSITNNNAYLHKVWKEFTRKTTQWRILRYNINYTPIIFTSILFLVLYFPQILHPVLFVLILSFVLNIIYTTFKGRNYMTKYISHMYQEIKNQFKYFVPRLFASIFAVWFAIYKLYDGISIESYVEINSALGFIALVYLIYEINVCKIRKAYMVIYRAVKFFLLCFVYSFSIGYCVINILSPNKYFISPKFIFFVLVAMIIGIFIQFIISDSKITQPIDKK